MIYPTLEEVNAAERIDICIWWRALASPVNKAQAEVNVRLAERFKEVGGFTPEISKQLGWNYQ
ncbi:MAG: hypothetical protein QM503_04675 [Bacteroidota bacterium]